MIILQHLTYRLFSTLLALSSVNIRVSLCSFTSLIVTPVGIASIYFENNGKRQISIERLLCQSKVI